MNKTELKVLRHALYYSVAEAAKHIAYCAPRTWQSWEAGERNIPKDVIEEMYRLRQERQFRIDAVEDLSAEHDYPEIELDWYATFEEYKADHVDGHYWHWKLAQSVAVYVVAENMGKIKERHK